MPLEKVMHDLWGLKSNPFTPDIDFSGEKLNPDLLDLTLDPNRDPRIASFYFDLYQWEYSEAINGMLQGQGLKRVINKKKLARIEEARLIIITGDSDSGRRSLKNLIFYHCSDANPIIIRAPIGPARKTGALAALAEFFVDEIKTTEPNVPKDELLQIYDQKKETLGANPSNYHTLFSRYNMAIRNYSSRPIILDVNGGDHSDTWGMVWEAVKSMVSLIVITTSKDVQAKTCYERLGRKYVCWIKAPPLDYEKATQFISARISMYRDENLTPVIAGDSLAPFSKDAINMLYKFKEGQPVTDFENPQTIGWIRERLSFIVESYQKELAKKDIHVEKNKIDDLLITAADVKRFFQNINQGRF